MAKTTRDEDELLDFPRLTPEERQRERDLYGDNALTDEQRREARRRLLADVERARRDGSYQRLAAALGTAKFSMTWQQLRDKDGDDDDDRD